jgi:anti-sigma factor RsiW
MTCDEAEILLNALLDGELDAGHAREVESHVQGCGRCAARLRSYREMQGKLHSSDLRFTAPPALRGRVERKLPSRGVSGRRDLLRGLLFGSVATAAAAAGLMFVVVNRDQDSRIATEAISAHLRSLQAEHLTDVASNDQHNVKPWFNGRSDLAPPVADLTAQGFTLIGGRLDYIDGKPAAAIVYRRRTHVINLFVVQSPNTQRAAARMETIQGFNVRRWNEQDLSLLAVSDLNADELEDFGAKFETAIGATAGS